MNAFKLKSIRENSKLYTIILIFFGLLAGVFFYYNNYAIPKVVEKTESETIAKVDVNAEPKIKVVVVKEGVNVSKYTDLTDEMIEQSFEVIEVPQSFAVQQAISDLEELEGFVTKEDLRSGEQIHAESLSGYGKWYKDFDRLKEYSIDSVVAEEVKQGNIVDVIINYGDGDYDVIIPKTRVMKLLQGDSSGIIPNYQVDAELDPENENADEDSLFQDKEYVAVVAIEESDYRDLNLAKHLGKFELRLYIDEDQPESTKTFSYPEGLMRAKYAVDQQEEADTPYLLEFPEQEKMNAEEMEEYNTLVDKYYGNRESLRINTPADAAADTDSED